ncbi:MAG: DUF2156 domain-containing protein [Clostridiaceae bacterium]|nr:DUF2156 domain-containing protein [Clostridiaceae bacterium]
MQWKEIEISDMELLDKIYRKTNSQASEMVFSNMFMWRRSYNSRFTIANNMLLMVSNPKRFPPFAFCPLPVGEFRGDDFVNAVYTLKEYFDSRGWKLVFGRVEENMVPLFKKYLDAKLTIKKIDAISDYIYSTESLITLAGKKLSSKRNHINRFMREYGGFEYVELKKEHIDECKRIFDKWCEKNEASEACNCETDSPECERWACFELLDNWERIPTLKGALIKVNGSFEAFTVGEMLNEDTAVIHIEKGNTDIHGIYAVINREFVARTFPHTKYINREEDMGKSGLRKAKMSYMPISRVYKYTICPVFN